LGSAVGFAAQGDGPVFCENLSAGGTHAPVEEKGGFHFGDEPRITVFRSDFNKEVTVKSDRQYSDFL
jgi:hypothetical protein